MVFAERELIELPDAVPVVALQHVEKLENFGHMYGADHEVVIPAAQVVVHVHAKQAAAIDNQLRRASW